MVTEPRNLVNCMVRRFFWTSCRTTGLSLDYYSLSGNRGHVSQIQLRSLLPSNPVSTVVTKDVHTIATINGIRMFNPSSICNLLSGFEGLSMWEAQITQ